MLNDVISRQTIGKFLMKLPDILFPDYRCRNFGESSSFCNFGNGSQASSTPRKRCSCSRSLLYDEGKSSSKIEASTQVSPVIPNPPPLPLHLLVNPKDEDFDIKCKPISVEDLANVKLRRRHRQEEPSSSSAASATTSRDSTTIGGHNKKSKTTSASSTTARMGITRTTPVRDMWNALKTRYIAMHSPSIMPSTSTTSSWRGEEEEEDEIGEEENEEQEFHCSFNGVTEAPAPAAARDHANDNDGKTATAPEEYHLRDRKEEEEEVMLVHTLSEADDHGTTTTALPMALVREIHGNFN